jgi:ketosteroid isomerase-like protein
MSGGTLILELHDVLVNDEHVVALYIVRAERAAKQLNDNEILVYHVRDGKVCLRTVSVQASCAARATPALTGINRHVNDYTARARFKPVA